MRARVIALIVGVITALVLVVGGASGKRYAPRYYGPSGCPSWVAPYTTVSCAYHTGIRRITVHASTSHWGGVYWRSGSCYYNGCTSDSGWLPYPWNGRPRMSNFTGRWMYVYGATDYQ